MSQNNINIIFFSDTHLGFDYPLRPRVNRRRRGEDFFRNFEAVLTYAKNKNCDLIIHGGDLFFRSKVPEPIIDRAYQVLLNFADNGIPIYILPGNHERSSLPVSIFLNHPLIHVFEKPKSFYFEIRGTGILIGGFPFIRENLTADFSSLLKRAGWYRKNSCIKLLVLHQAIEGAKVGPGDYTFRRGKDVLPVSLLPGDASAILCGHIHRRQILYKKALTDDSTLPVIFCGSIERTSFAEKDEVKGFYHMVFNRDDDNKRGLRELKFIELPARSMEDINIDTIPSGQNFNSYIKRIIHRFNKNSIVRFKSSRLEQSEFSDLLTSKNLQRLLPSSMNFSISPQLFNREKE